MNPLVSLIHSPNLSFSSGYKLLILLSFVLFFLVSNHETTQSTGQGPLCTTVWQIDTKLKEMLTKLRDITLYMPCCSGYSIVVMITISRMRLTHDPWPLKTEKVDPWNLHLMRLTLFIFLYKIHWVRGGTTQDHLTWYEPHEVDFSGHRANIPPSKGMICHHPTPLSSTPPPLRREPHAIHIEQHVSKA